MKIELEGSYKSILPFGAVQLPSFTVLLGLNGSGKSQLLEAIQHQRAKCDLLPPLGPYDTWEIHSDVVLLTNASLTLRSDMFQRGEKGNPLTRDIFDSHRDATFGQISGALESAFPKATRGGETIREILEKPRDQLLPVNDDGNRQNKTWAINHANELLANSVVHYSHSPAQQAIQRVVKHEKIEARHVTYEQAKTFGSWGDHAPFNSQLTRLFGGYRAERIANDRLAAKEGKPAASSWLNPGEFKAKFGAPPWEQISSTMETFGLNYRFAPPPEREIDPIVLFFERLNDEITHVEFESLSAGEKVLVILAIALLNIDNFRAAVETPKLLLLDEVDASLHPAVLHHWMTTIEEKVVKDMGIPCIMTTHSPVTVALAPEASLYQMVRGPDPVSKIAKRHALNKLTVGLPSMEVEFTKRRQVFVESETDAEAYDRLHTLMKAEFQLSCSLSFLSTGIKKKCSEEGTGCDAVKKVVGELAGFGSLSTFGLLDWDGEKIPKGRIQILAEHSHYAFDNIILNPLLVGLLLIRKCTPPAKDLPRFLGVDQIEIDALQGIADAVQSKLKYPPGAASGQVEVQFISGIKIKTDKAFCLSNGHKMEEALLQAFPTLKTTIRRRGDFALEVIDGVLGDYPMLCPQPLADAFRLLADADP